MNRALLLLLGMAVAACSGSRELSYPDVPATTKRVVAERTGGSGRSPWVHPEPPPSPTVDSSEVRLKQSIAAAGAALKKELSLGGEPVADRDAWMAALLRVPSDQEIARRDQLIEQLRPYMPLIESEGSLEEAARQLGAFQRSGSVEALRQAVRELEAYVRRYPADARARLYLSRAYQMAARLAQDRGLEDEALDHLRRLLYLNAADVAAWVDMARLLEQRGETAGAAYAWEMAARSRLVGEQQDAAQALRLYVQAERSYARAGMMARALMALGEAQALVNSPEDSQLVADERAWLLWDAPRIETRLAYDRLLEQVDHLTPERAQALIPEAEALYQQVSRYEARIDAARLLALLYHTGNMTDRAITLLRPEAQAAARLPVRSEAEQKLLEDYAAYLMAEAARLATAGERQQAAELLLEAGDLNVGARSQQALLAAARLYLPLPDRALELLDRIDPDQLDDPREYYRLRFETLRALGRLDEARKIYDLLSTL